MSLLTLIPLETHHAAPLQSVYAAAPGYWSLFGISALPADQAHRDLSEAAATPGRTLLGIIRSAADDGPAAGHVMVGAMDLRRGFPDESDVTLGLLIIAETCQRHGIGRAAWALLEPWLAQQPGLVTTRLGIEQFNIPALHFFTALGFSLTGQASRRKVGELLVRYLEMEKLLAQEHTAPS